MNKRYIPLFIILLFLGLITGNAYAQRSQQVKSITIESVVKDDQGAPIPNAIISGKEGAIEVISDANGQFSIEVPENTDLLIEAKGFENKILTTTLAAQAVTLTKAPFLMDQASKVNVPFTKINKRDITNSITVINADEIVKNDNTQSIYDFLVGRVPGMLGSNYIRGIGSAVFIIDGIPRDPTYLNMEEVQQITILKDVNAAMLYGTQARNGLILITTKRGQAYKRKLNFTVEQGMSKPVALPKYLNSADYMAMYNEALVNDGLPKKYDDTTIAKYASGQNPWEYPDRDYYTSEYLNSNKPFTKFLTEFSGGNAVTQYYANASWIHSGTLYAIGEGAKTSTDRFNVRANVNLRINDFITGYIDAVGIFSIMDNPRGNFWNTAATEHPDYYSNLLPVNLISDTAKMLAGADLKQAKRVNGNYILGGTKSFKDNVYGNMNFGGYDQMLQRTATFNNGVEFDLDAVVKGLKLRTYLSFDIYNSYHQILSNTYAVYLPTWQINPGGTDTIVKLEQINKDVSTGVQELPATGMSYTRMIGANVLLDYNRTFNESHHISGTLLAYHDRLRVSDLFADEKHSHIGLRIAYNYESKYFVDFNGAYVNGFRLPKGNKGAFSPSIGLAMILSENAGSSAVNYLKLKASAGILNTEFNSLDYKLYESTYVGSSSFSWNDGGRSNTAIISQRAANPNLTFEKMKNINVGVEGYFFNNLLYIDANFFTTKNTGQLVQRTTFPAYLYLNIPYENYNETSYTGGELGVIVTKSLGDLKIDLGANFLYASSKATVRSEIWANDYQYRQGLPNDVIFGLEAIGLFADSADILASPAQWFGEVRKGDIKYKDQNGDNKIDQDDAVEIGNSIPNISYGLTLNLRYKNINLFALGNGQSGSESYYSGSYFRPVGDSKFSEEVQNRWTPATAATATYPRLSSKTSSNNNQNSTFWLYSNNYFRIDHVQLTVDLPSNIAKKISSKGIDIYLRGDNLVRFSEDAEKRQLVIGAEPNYRSFAVGVKLMF